MKNLSLISCLFIVLGMASCKKDNATSKPTAATAINNPAIVGTWSVVRDSTITPTGGILYIGQNTDRYIFTSKGQLYAQEGDFLLDTATFTFKTKSQINLVYKFYYKDGVSLKGNVGGYDIDTLNATTLILSNGIISPEGYYGDIVTLKKN